MIHGINNQFLYAVTRLQCACSNGTVKKNYSGTGFFVNKDNKPYLITNRHVAEPSYHNDELKGFTLNSMTFDMRSFDKNTGKVYVSSCHLVSWQITLPENDNDDVACLYDIRILKSSTDNICYIPYSFLASSDKLKQKICVCDFIAFIGFPEVYDRKNNMPILRTGAISSDPRLDYSYSESTDLGHVIAYEAFSKDGSSGSPVFALQKGFPVTGNVIKVDDDFYRELCLIGINAGCISMTISLKDDVKYKEHQQLSYMYKSDVIIELIDMASKVNQMP